MGCVLVFIGFNNELGELIEDGGKLIPLGFIPYFQAIELPAESGFERFMLDHRPNMATVRHIRSKSLLVPKDIKFLILTVAYEDLSPAKVNVTSSLRPRRKSVRPFRRAFEW